MEASYRCRRVAASREVTPHRSRVAESELKGRPFGLPGEERPELEASVSHLSFGEFTFGHRGISTRSRVKHCDGRTIFEVHAEKRRRQNVLTQSERVCGVVE